MPHAWRQAAPRWRLPWQPFAAAPAIAWMLARGGPTGLVVGGLALIGVGLWILRWTEARHDEIRRRFDARHAATEAEYRARRAANARAHADRNRSGARAWAVITDNTALLVLAVLSLSALLAGAWMLGLLGYVLLIGGALGSFGALVMTLTIIFGEWMERAP